MTLPTLVMPASIPDWLVSPHDFTLGAPFAVIAFASGHNRRRRVATGPAQTLSAELLLTEAQSVVFHDWFEDDTEGGALPFAARTIGPDGARQWWHARFAAPPSWSALPTGTGPMWQVSAQMRLEGEPSDTAPA